MQEISLKEAIKKLNSREKLVLDLRFYKGRTQIEVADEIGISQAQVSRIEKCFKEYEKICISNPWTVNIILI